MAQPFDSRALRSDGEALPIAEGVQRFLDLVALGAFSASTTGLLAYQTGTGGGLYQLTWFDRAGKPTGTLGDARPFFGFSLSPDRKNLLASASDSLGNFDLWMYDVTTGVPTRFTFDPAGEYHPVWSPDGRSVIFNSTRKGHYDLYRKSVKGAGAEELLYADDMDKVPTSWSSDGKVLLYFTGGGPRHDLWVLPLKTEPPGGGLKPVPFLKTGFNELNATFSPDGQWVAYDSDESGESEVYIAPFSRVTEKQQISRNGGQRPQWRQDGKEIFFETLNGNLLAAEVRMTAQGVVVGAVRTVIAGTFRGSSSGYYYDVSADGQRILVAVSAAGQKPAEPVTLIQQWTGPLKK
jgi:Tol biopolymer transport system component